MFPFSQNLTFRACVAVLCAITFVVSRRYVRRQLAVAPKSALRSRAQRALHRVSLILVVAPLAYVALVDGQPFWAVFAILWVRGACMSLLRFTRVRFAIRLGLLAPVAVASIAVGAAVMTWPAFVPSELRAAPWPTLVAAALAFALSDAVSMVSFPKGHGERIR